LESYFMAVDAVASRLAAVSEYIEDTEDLVNLELDYSRNRLLKIEIRITIATVCIAIYACVAGVLGENLVLPGAITKGLAGFVAVNAACIAACAATYWLCVRSLRRRKLI
jgi:energy-converting hydrogenase Eha subunit G